MQCWPNHSPACSSARFLAASSLCFRMMANRARSALASSVFPCACNFWYLSFAFCFSISSRSRRDNWGFGPVPICSTCSAKVLKCATNLLQFCQQGNVKQNYGRQNKNYKPFCAQPQLLMPECLHSCLYGLWYVCWECLFSPMKFSLISHAFCTRLLINIVL